MGHQQSLPETPVSAAIAHNHTAFDTMQFPIPLHYEIHTLPVATTASSHTGSKQRRRLRMRVTLSLVWCKNVVLQSRRTFVLVVNALLHTVKSIGLGSWCTLQSNSNCMQTNVTIPYTAHTVCSNKKKHPPRLLQSFVHIYLRYLCTDF